MKTNRKPTLSMLDHAQKTFVRSRPGSVLILVIALLVLMALIGTAYMSMAQADRQTSVQHENNTEIDMLMEGLANVVRGTVAGDLYNQSKYRPGPGYNLALSNNFKNFTGLGLDQATLSSAAPLANVNPGTPFLSSRVPELQQELSLAADGNTTSPNNLPLWGHITAPLIGGQFSSPILPTHANTSTFLLGQSTNSYTYTQRSSRYGTAWAQPLLPGVFPNTNLPAWVNNPTLAPNAILAVVAADADGDGIADAGLIKLPIGSINGLTYYAAFRVVDNNSAVNVNTAWQHNPIVDLTTGPALPGDFFPTSIDLAAMVAGNDSGPLRDLQYVAKYRLGIDPFNSTKITPIDTLPMYDDNGAVRQDVSPALNFSTLLEAEWMQLGRRINNPSWVGAGQRGVPFQTSESVNLTRGFVLRDPNTLPSDLEKYLQNSLTTAADPTFPLPTAPYNPAATAFWYNTNFAFLNREFSAAGAGTPAPVVPLRSMLTTSNAVSNFAPNKFNDRGVYDSSLTYAFGDSVLDSTKTYRYVCINPFNTATVAPGISPLYVPTLTSPPYQTQSQAWAYDNDTWVRMPWTDAPTKISVNTGTFGQLYTAYWSAMAEQQVNSAGVTTTSAPFSEISTEVSPKTGVSSRMFRSPLRLPPGVPAPANPARLARSLTPHQVMQLRAALAAVNTIDMRDNDDDVTSRQVVLTPTPAEISAGAATIGNVVATVYGQEPQPFITEVYATNEQSPASTPPAPGYIAIKLFNPYNFALHLDNYQLGYIRRDKSLYIGPAFTLPTLSIVPIIPPAPWVGNNAPIIPPNGFIVITSAAGNSYDGGPDGTLSLPNNIAAGGAQIMPAPVNGTTLIFPKVAQYVVPNLVPNALDNELVLLRPRRGYNALYVANGTLTKSAAQVTNSAMVHHPEGIFDETTATGSIGDMVPVDSYDFSGLTVITNTATEKAMEWHYMRPSDPEADPTTDRYSSWHWVYPGHYLIQSTNATPAPPIPDTIDASSKTDFPRFIDGTYRGKFPGGSFTSVAPPVLAIPAALIVAPNTAPQPGELWTMAQYCQFFGPQGIYVNPLFPYHDIPIRLNTPDSAGPNNMLHISRTSGTAEPLAYPFGGFARNGDILQVPFIGAYKISLPGSVSNIFIELNSVSMDSVMALASFQTAWNEITPLEDETTGNCDPIYVPQIPRTLPVQAIENVGRFSPMNPFDGGGVSNSKVVFNDYLPGLASSGLWRYHFATRLLDYLTVQSPQQDGMVDVDPAATDPLDVVSNTTNPNLPYKYPRTLGTAATANFLPFPVANSLPSTVYNNEFTNPGTEQAVGVQGLVNINTAPWRVLAAVPWMPPDPAAGTTDNGPRALNAAIGLCIAYYRDVNDGSGNPHGPFRNLFELNNVPIFVAPPFVAAVGAVAPNTYFKDLMTSIPRYTKAGYTDLVKGNLQAAYSTAGANHNDLTTGDFQNQFLMMNRISNLVTTRSDSFTAYILLQGWKDAETPNATMVVQRRAAYIIDRNGVLGAVKATPSMTYVPNN